MIFSKKKSAKLYPLFVSICIIFIAISAYAIGVPFLKTIEFKTMDLRFTARGAVAPGPEVVLAVIDEKSISEVGKWPWPRSKTAEIVEKISKAGARVITFDIGFFELSGKEILQIIEQVQRKTRELDIRNAAFQEHLESLKLKSDKDQLLADAITGSGAKIVLGYFFEKEKEEASHIDEKMIRVHLKNISSSVYQLVRYESREAENVSPFPAATPRSNIDPISNAAEYSGFFNMDPDMDGVVRSLYAGIQFGGDFHAPLSLATARAYLDRPLTMSVGEEGVEEILIGELLIPTDKSGRFLINYRGGYRTFPYVSVLDILEEKIPDGELKDKIVILGGTAAGLFDIKISPFSQVFPGPEIHANVVDNILYGDFLQQPWWTPLFDILAMIVAGLFLGVVLPRAGVLAGAGAGIAIFSSHIVLCQYLFSENGWVLNMVYPLLVTVLVYVGVTAFKYLTESRQKRYIKRAFSAYLAPVVVDKLIESPEMLELGGEEREITAFFSDVQGFTSISESLAPKALVAFLNDFLTEMTDIILKYEGTVDKFEGDAIIAFFGAPNALENHAEIACKASIEMQKRLSELRAAWKKENQPELFMRIGLCTGRAVVGNMGSVNRMDYTMMGDTVNTAARLEGVNKKYGTYNLISESTRRAAGNGVIAREIDQVNVVGKKEPVSIHELLGFPGDPAPAMIETVDHYSRGLAEYRARNWDQAIAHFTKGAAASPDDAPTRVMLNRCMHLKKKPPSPNWDGTTIIKSK